MESGTPFPGPWVCPQCDARLVSRNLSHSCGQFTLKDLFAHSDPEVLGLARSYVAMLHGLGEGQVLPQKTRLVCVARVRFAGLTPRRNSFLASFALHRWLDSERIVKTADHGTRWRGHFVRVSSEHDLDDELRAWLQESHDVVGLRQRLRDTWPAGDGVGDSDQAGQVTGIENLPTSVGSWTST